MFVTEGENDNTGLYYYRARYYSPELHRFISEDPILRPISSKCLGGIHGNRFVWVLPSLIKNPQSLHAVGVAHSTDRISKTTQLWEREGAIP
ncbi:MAG: hypothetical protein HY754_07785 [Nitrospirae bacterium]|nr:hypothetical protein [Nitrospirota bacterium]